MSVAEGMETGRARSIADQLRSQGSVIGDVAARGSAMMSVLEDVWQGPDVEQFAREWGSARPQLDRAEQLVRDMGEELARQAEDQDRASEGSGIGPGSPQLPKLPGLPDFPGLPGLPKLPSFPDIFGVIGDLLKGAWDFLRSSAYSIPALLADALAWADEAFQVLKNLKWLKWLSLPLKLLGRVTPFIGAVLGLWDMGEAIYRWFTEGFSKDSVLQFFQGLTGTIAGGLGIAAIFATGTILGAPAGLVLGALALVFGGISIGIGIYREFDDEIDAAAKWAWDNGLIGGPLNPNSPLPGFPLPLPQFPPPTIPGPGLPDWPGAPTPTVPQLPIPNLPGIPTPTFPSLPSLPGLPKPSFPGIPMPRLW